MSRRHLLMVSHTFPPYQESPGVSIRFVKFIKYLARHRPEWQIDVVTAGFCGAEPMLSQTGMYLLEDVPADVRIFRINDPYYASIGSAGRGRQLWLRGKQLIKRWALRHPVAFRALWGAYQLERRLLKSVGSRKPTGARLSGSPSTNTLYPDPHVTWHAPVLAWLSQQRNADYDLIFVTIPIVSTALLGVEIKKQLGVPLVLDVRDDWSDYWAPGSERERIERPMEQSVVRAADLVVVVSPEIEESYRRRHPQLSRIVVIPNGVDLEDFADLWRRPMPSRFVVTCVGRMVYRSPVTFMHAFRRLLDDADVDARQCEVRFPDNMYPEWWQAGFELGLGRYLRRVPVLEREEYLRLLMDSSVLLVIQMLGRTGAVAGKMYEYWATGRPVLLLDAPGIGTDFVEHYGFGCSAHPDDIDAIHRALRSLYFAHRAGQTPQRPADAIHEFSREALTLRLIDNLEALLAAEKRDG